MSPGDTSDRFSRYLLTLERAFAAPVLLSAVYLRGGRPGVNLESAPVRNVCRTEVLRLFYTAFGLAESRADYYLERPEPLAWALAAFMRSFRLSPTELKARCLERIESSGVANTHLLRECIERSRVLSQDEHPESRLNPHQSALLR
jgi:hypothetical protein